MNKLDPEAIAWDRLAHTYHDASITPFDLGPAFRLRGDLRKGVAAIRKVRPVEQVLDCGCGTGDAMALLVDRFPLVVGLDFSPQMLQLTARRFGAPPPRTSRDAASLVARKGERRIVVVEGDLRDLSGLANWSDVTLSVNSICPARPKDAFRMIHEIAGTVRDGGLAYLVTPALEASEHLFDLGERHGDDLSELGSVDMRRGLFIYADGEEQKHLRALEIEEQLRSAGLRLLYLEKVLYPWRQMKDAGWGYYPREERLWDWYAVAARCTAARARELRARLRPSG